MPKVSIIMPFHNQEEFTRKATDSLYLFTDHDDFELILVDNGSDSPFCRYDLKPKVKVIRNEKNLGWCKALNQGFEAVSADSDFVLWANNDIVFEENWLPKMIAHFRPGVGALGPTSNYVLGRQSSGYNTGVWEEEVNWLIGFFLMFRRGVVDAVGDVDERFSPGGSEEWDYIIRMQQKLGLKCIIARDVYIHHFGSQTINATVAKTKEEYNKYFVEKDRILRDKWGDDFINKWNPQKISAPQGIYTSPWPANCKLGLAMPHTWSHIDYNTHLSLLGLRKPNMVVLEAGRGGEMDTKREYQIQSGMKQGCTHFWICDGDMLYPEMILVDLFKVLADGADMAGGLVYRGYPPYEPVIWHPTESRLLAPFSDFKFGDVVEAGATGAACLLVKREVFEKLPSPWFQYRYEKKEADEHIFRESEDYHFTRKATKAGFKLRIFTKYDVGHLREFSIDRQMWLCMKMFSMALGPLQDWGSAVALVKKLQDREWFEREINNACHVAHWKFASQKQYEIGLLYNFLQGKKIKSAIEVGTFRGATALFWADLVRERDGTVYCVDKDFMNLDDSYKESGLRTYIEEIAGDSHSPDTVARVRKSVNGGVDFLFIDGDHSYQGVKADFENFSPMVKRGGWIAFHDIVDSELMRKEGCGVQQLWREIADGYNHFEILDPNDKNWCGIGVIQQK